MRYILDNEGYIESIAFGSYIECSNKSCTEYTGNIPEGYNSLCEWADIANIQAYYLVNGNLTYDSVRDEQLQRKWEEELQNNTPKEYELPTASETTLGGVKVGAGLSINEGVLSATGGGTGISLLDVYPIGSIYMSVNNVNPSTLFGGTWVAWGSGKVPVGVDTSQTEFNTVEKTGGEKTHTLTVEEMPSHNHILWGVRKYQADGTNAWVQDGEANVAVEEAKTTVTGGSQPHNILQPYITCFMWKRTA